MSSTSKFDIPTEPGQPQPRKKLKWGRWLLLGCGGLIGWFWLVGSATRHTYEDGVRAYEAGDCTQAIAKFDRVIGDRPVASRDPDDLVAQANAKKVECQAYQKAIAPITEQPGKALANASGFTLRYPNSKLMQPLRQAIASMVQQTNAKTLATSNSCRVLDTIKTTNLMSDATAKLPPLYQACGDLFASSQQLPQAIALYEKFFDQYPNHPLENSVKKSYAQAIVKDARKKGSGTIAAPGQTGVAANGSTVVSIRNDAPNLVRIVFSGPTPRVEELAPCKNCKVFTPSSLPNGCPNKGPKATYTLQPGQYEVMVKTVDGRRVTPFTGSWNLNNGAQYGHCFYIVRGPARQ